MTSVEESGLNFGLITAGWELRGTSGWALRAGHFGLGTSGWELRAGNFGALRAEPSWGVGARDHSCWASRVTIALFSMRIHAPARLSALRTSEVVNTFLMTRRRSAARVSLASLRAMSYAVILTFGRNDPTPSAILNNTEVADRSR